MFAAIGGLVIYGLAFYGLVVLLKGLSRYRGEDDE